MNSLAMDEPRGAPLTLRIVRVVCFNFLTYLVIGLQMAVLPAFVHDGLHYGPVLAGLAISTQYVATLFSRGLAGRMSDVEGPKRAVLVGLTATGASALLLFLAAWLRAWPAASLATVLLGRLVLGVGESCVGTGCIIWGIGQVGALNTAKVISWSGVATYSALAIGAPLGVLLAGRLGFAAIGGAGVLLMLGALALAWRRADVKVEVGERLPMRHVFGRVTPQGLGLALGGIGFGVIATFITLYYASVGWSHAAFALSVFGLCFVGMRLLFAGAIGRYGGYRVALASLLIESGGLVLLASARGLGIATLGAAMTGLGFSLIFPALGVEAVNRVSVSNRGAALAAYSVFIDVALAAIGPLGGWIAGGGRYASLFGVAAGLALLAALLTVALYARQGRAAVAA
ncbi:MFS transporter [Frateuria defendens]|uniref:MFS transporter n=1 Tax=Frateuria defendens TaxID=2219559 RepID=UPI00066FFF55|nr:MFS transporter [Frateuria defendens]